MHRLTCSCLCLNRRHATGWLALALLASQARAQGNVAAPVGRSGLPSLGDAGAMTTLKSASWATPSSASCTATRTTSTTR